MVLPGEAGLTFPAPPAGRMEACDLDPTNQEQPKEIWLRGKKLVAAALRPAQHLQCWCLEAMGPCVQPVQWRVTITAPGYVMSCLILWASQGLCKLMHIR